MRVVEKSFSKISPYEVSLGEYWEKHNINLPPNPTLTLGDVKYWKNT